MKKIKLLKLNNNGVVFFIAIVIASIYANLAMSNNTYAAVTADYCVKLANTTTSNPDEIKKAKECVESNYCAGEDANPTLTRKFGRIQSYSVHDCGGAKKAVADKKRRQEAKKQQAALEEEEREEEANKRMKKSCPQYTGDRYVPDMGAAMQCYEKGFCIVENGKYNCDEKAVAAAKKADADKKAADGSSGSSGASGGEGTKNPSRAEGSLSGDGIGSDPVGDFLGFPAWNRDVHFSPGSEIGPQVMKIVLNITEILLRLAGIAAVIVIIYAGAMFIIGSYSSSPDGIAKAKTILINGVIGLIIAIAATAIVSFIAGSLKGK